MTKFEIFKILNKNIELINKFKQTGDQALLDKAIHLNKNNLESFKESLANELYDTGKLLKFIEDNEEEK